MVVLGTSQLGETQDQCHQKIQHTSQGRDFLVVVQLFEDRAASEQRVEGLLTLILEDRSKNIIEDCRVGACLAVGFLAPARSILIHFRWVRDEMPSKLDMSDGRSCTLCQNGQNKWSCHDLPSLPSPPWGRKVLRDQPFLPAVVSAGVVTYRRCPLASHALLITIQVRDKGGSLAVKRILMRGEIAYFKGFLSALLHPVNNRVISLLLSPCIESDTVHYEECWRNPLLFVHLSWLVPERTPGHLHGWGVSAGQHQPLRGCQQCGFETFSEVDMRVKEDKIPQKAYQCDLKYVGYLQ